MSWKMFGKPIYTADNVAATPGAYQKFKSTANNVLRAVRCGVIQYNNPTYTSVVMKLYADRNGSIGKLLATSTNSVTKATIAPTQAHAYSEVYFTFNDFPIRANTYYYWALFINGAYVGNSTTHLALKNGYPEAIYKTGVTETLEAAAKYPFDTEIIGATIP